MLWLLCITVALTKTFEYDALGRLERQVLTVPDAAGGPDQVDTTLFHYDGRHLTLTWQPVEGNTRKSRNFRFYTHSDRTDELLAVTLADPASVAAADRNVGIVPQADVSFYAHTDHQGSIRALTDEAGTVVNDYAYDSYGREELAVEGLTQRFRYTGREYDRDIGLYHYRARIYDPETGRFLQEDPIGFEALLPNWEYLFEDGGLLNKLDGMQRIAIASERNFYRYVSNNPTNFVDPSGLAGNKGFVAIAALTTLKIVKGVRRLGGAVNEKITAKFLMARQDVLDSGGCIAIIFSEVNGTGGGPSIADGIPMNSHKKNACKIAGKLAKAVFTFYGTITGGV